MALPLLELTGTPYEQGLVHGEALREPIAQNIAIYFERFERECKLPRTDVLERAIHYAAAIKWQNADYYAGMQGIAAASGFSLAEIAALNVRYELFYYQFGVNALADGCTAFALLPNVTASGTLLIGENWDWIVGVKGAVLRSEAKDGLRTLSFTEAGIFGGKIGLNSAGLGLLINGLTSTDDDWSRLAKPFHVRCYEIMRQRDFEAAVRVVTDSDRSCSTNFLIAQVPDRVVNIESAPHGTALTGCRRGCLVHANHFVDPGSLSVVEPPVEKTPHSYHRHARLEKILRAKRPVTMAQIEAALRDHEEFPYSVCFHLDPNEPPEEYYESVASMIMDLHAGTLRLSDGPPCENEYVEYTI
jgi:isopenicillin-N N-acyltransferase-like protein